jgi:hypothetical protein
LRDWGYIRSSKHPSNARRRVHRVIFNDQDKEWDRDTFPTGKVSPDTFPTGKEILSPQGNYRPIFGGDKKLKDLEISRNSQPPNICSEHTRKNINGADKETDCAEAHSRERTAVENPEQYLGHCEALLSSPDAASLKFERNLIAELADDPCQPEQVTERAAKLLSRIR